MRELPPSYSLRARNAGAPGAFGLHDVVVGADETWGWAVGEFGTVLRLVHVEGEGSTWVPDLAASDLTRRALLAIDVGADGRNGWAVGHGGVVLRLQQGAWVLDEAASEVTRQRLDWVSVSDSGREGVAIGVSLYPAPKVDDAVSVLLRTDGAHAGPPPSKVASKDCLLAHGDADVWFRCLADCPEPKREGAKVQRLWRLGASQWESHGGCDERATQLPVDPVPAYHHRGWSASGVEGRTGQLWRSTPGGSRVPQLEAVRPTVVVPGFEAFPLTIDTETQSLDSCLTASYELELIVSERIGRGRLDAMLVALDQSIMGEQGSEPYDRFHATLRVDAGAEVIASVSHKWGFEPKFSNELRERSLGETLTDALVGSPP